MSRQSHGDVVEARIVRAFASGAFDATLATYRDGVTWHEVAAHVRSERGARDLSPDAIRTALRRLTAVGVLAYARPGHSVARWRPVGDLPDFQKAATDPLFRQAPFNERFLVRTARAVQEEMIVHGSPGYDRLAVADTTRKALHSLRLMPSGKALPACVWMERLSRKMADQDEPRPRNALVPPGYLRTQVHAAMDLLLERGEVRQVGRRNGHPLWRLVKPYEAPRPYLPWAGNVPGWWEVMEAPERPLNTYGTARRREWTPPPRPPEGSHPALRDFQNYWPEAAR